jgi:hypothetical protein
MMFANMIEKVSAPRFGTVPRASPLIAMPRERASGTGVDVRATHRDPDAVKKTSHHDRPAQQKGKTAQRRRLKRQNDKIAEIGVPRSMKMGAIALPWRYDAGAHPHAPNRRRLFLTVPSSSDTCRAYRLLQDQRGAGSVKR